MSYHYKKGVDMKIKSNFRDYYDYISDEYGGGDPNTVYVRHSLNENTQLTNLDRSEIFIDSFKYKDSDVHVGVLSVAGNIYYVHHVVDYEKSFAKGVPYNFKAAKPNEWKLLAPQDMDRYISADCFKKESSRCNVYRKFNGKQDFRIIEAARKLNAPVFILNAEPSFAGSIAKVEKYVPSLAKLGFQSVMDAQTVYRDIEFFMNNVLRDTPDTKPPVDISDKDRIRQHGFDLKASFRHRK